MVHIRDVTGDWKTVENANREDFERDAYALEVFPGKGIAKVEQVMRRLHGIGYQGVVQPEHLGPPSEAELLPGCDAVLQGYDPAGLSEAKQSGNVSACFSVFRDGAQKWAQSVATSLVTRIAPLYPNTRFNAKAYKESDSVTWSNVSTRVAF